MGRRYKIRIQVTIMSTDNKTNSGKSQVKLSNGAIVKLTAIDQSLLSRLLSKIGKPEIAIGEDGRPNPTDPRNRTYEIIWESEFMTRKADFTFSEGVKSIEYPDSFEGIRHDSPEFKAKMIEYDESISTDSKLLALYIQYEHHDKKKQIEDKIDKLSGMIKEEEVGN